MMSGFLVVTLLILSAALEAGGDALMRMGLHAGSPGKRVAFIICGALILSLYGITVNLPPWDFGRLLGVYVIVFFIFTQLLGYWMDRKPLSGMMWAGSALILIGGIVFALGQRGHS